MRLGSLAVLPGRPGAARRPRSALMRGLQGPARGILLTYGMLATLFIITALCGQFGVSAGRPLFIAGGLAVGLFAYRAGGLPLNAEAVIVLFAFAPLMRRLIDVHIGYNPSGVMLAAPLAAMAAAMPELRLLLTARGRVARMLTPYGIALACVVYAWSLSAFGGNMLLSTILAAKLVLPIAYCVCLLVRPDQSEPVLAAAVRCFLIVSPVIGIYGIMQHLDPQPWDAYWMAASKIPSIGKPLPGMVRVFSTMNAPVSFAAYATFGLLLFSFSPRTYIPLILVPFVCIFPLCLAILLTGVRTAWISTAVSLLVCVMFRRTRGRAMLMICCLAVGVAGAVTLTSFGNTVADRMATMNNNVASDGSGAERLSDYDHVFREDNRYIFGVGLAPVDQDTKMMAMDGQLLSSAVEMGTTVGVIFVLMICWAAGQALMTVRRDDGQLRLVAAALIVGNLAILPLTAVAMGEIGFLFWFLIGVMSAPAVAKSGAFETGRRRAIARA